ncbi:MAG: N-formylglutamate deformylase [Halieaceae bacterium]
MKTFDFIAGTGPLLLSMPHCGTELPPALAATMTPGAQELADTDWHVDRLYAFARELGASIIRPYCSRYVIDLNRPADDSNLYPGANSTGLCPTSSFAEEPLYLAGQAPDEQEVARRLEQWWRPYHQQLETELARLQQAHGIALLFEAHSIRSTVPRLFDGRLPDLNVGTAGGQSCAPAMLAAVESVLAAQQDYSYVVDGRFKGGYITRAYGAPDAGVHSLQMELAQCLYMEEELPFNYLPERAAQLQPLLQRLLQAMITWAQAEVA